MERPDIIEFVTDPALLGLNLSPAQASLLRAAYGLSPADDEQRAIFQDCTGRTAWPVQSFPEITVIAGARAGKDSRILVPILLFEALFGGHEQHLAKGETGIIPLVAANERQTRIAFGFVKDYLLRSPVLASMVAEVLTSEIMLTNRLSAWCFACTQKSLRGWPMPAGGMDEVGFYRIEGQADSDVEIQSAIRRGMVAFPFSKLVKISSPYLRSGVLYDDFERAFGHDDPDLLCWRAASDLMNPTLRPERLEREKRLDPQRYTREYEAEFAGDLEAFLPAAWVDAAVVPGRGDLPPQEGLGYVGAVDPSGGGPDAFTVAVAHAVGYGAEARVVVDALRGYSRAGSAIGAAVKEIAVVLHRYGVREVEGDPYGAGWMRAAFQEAGIVYRNAARDKSAAYLELEPLLAQGRVELPDHPTLIRELKLLERRPPRAGGRAVVDHPRHAHDDFANSLALAAVRAVTGAGVELRPDHFQFFGPRATAPGRIWTGTSDLPAVADVDADVRDRRLPWDPGTRWD